MARNSNTSTRNWRRGAAVSASGIMCAALLGGMISLGTEAGAEADRGTGHADRSGSVPLVSLEYGPLVAPPERHVAPLPDRHVHPVAATPGAPAVPPTVSGPAGADVGPPVVAPATAAPRATPQATPRATPRAASKVAPATVSARRTVRTRYTATGGNPAARVIAYATAQLGKPYRWGGLGPDSFDCSGLVLMAYQSVGIRLPRTAAAQALVGDRIAPSAGIAALRPGDLVFWATDPASPATVHHVAIYLGDGLVLQAPHTGSVVGISRMWLAGYAGAVRILG